MSKSPYPKITELKICEIPEICERKFQILPLSHLDYYAHY